MAARCRGAAEKLIGLSRGWSLEREASDEGISEYGAIQAVPADSMAKLYASEMAGRVADRAVRIFGGRGCMTEHPVERYYREPRVDRISEGTGEVQRSIIARGLLKRGTDAYMMDG